LKAAHVTILGREVISKMFSRQFLASLAFATLLICSTGALAQQRSSHASVRPASTPEGVKKQKIELTQKHDRDKSELDAKCVSERSAPGLSEQGKKAVDQKCQRERRRLDEDYNGDISLLDQTLGELCRAALDAACQRFPPLLRDALCRNVSVPGCP
jgi:hypothetical protein